MSRLHRSSESNCHDYVVTRVVFKKCSVYPFYEKDNFLFLNRTGIILQFSHLKRWARLWVFSLPRTEGFIDFKAPYIKLPV